jgi:pimeloyl-ACP methyl ester carboxylesterase
MRIRMLAAAFAVLLASAACSGDDRPGESPSATVSGSTQEASFTDIEFTAADGERRPARLFGSGEVAVVLSHMGNTRSSQEDWAPFAGQAAEAGFQVLTYDNRADLSASWNDVLGAVDHLRNEGAETVIVGGASIGAMASLRAAIEPDSEINAVLWLAGVLNESGYAFTEADVSGLACPMLIASGSEDSYGAAEDAALLHEWTPDVSELLIVDSIRHGTDILAEDEPAVADELRQAMTDFLDGAVATTTTC